MKNWHTCAILASGPSMSAHVADQFREWKESTDGKVIVINTTHRLAPWADALYACDWQWWTHHIAEVRKSFRGELWTQAEASRDQFGLNYIKSERGLGLSRDPKVIYQGGGKHNAGNSGYQAVNLAYHWGAKRIILAGFDMHGRNWHGPHPHSPSLDSGFALWMRNFTTLAVDLDAEGVEVVNATPGSELKCFPLVSVEEALRARSMHAA